jgi:inner membrane protein
MALAFVRSGSVTIKAITVGIIVLILIVPLQMLRGLVSERSALREQAYQRVAQGWGGSVVVGGPMLVVPTERTVVEKDVQRVYREDIYVLPNELQVQANMTMDSEPRYVGIYAVPVYLSSLKMTGHFDFAALRRYASAPGVSYLWKEARLRLPLSDARSLRSVDAARLGTASLKLGPASPGLYRGVESPVDLSESILAEAAPFDFSTVLAGSRDFSVLPVGSTTSVRIESDWPHPSFQGAFLPAQRTIDDSGFDAHWQVLELNRSYPSMWRDGEVNETSLMESVLGVGLYQAVDVYQRGERAVKYALLFIGLTFLTFFAWEQLGRARMHPLQYLLVGLALSTFYLLLIALSEHLAFLLAYLISAAALVLLIGIYLAGVLSSAQRGLAAGSATTVVYGLLYALVLSEDYALLLGAIILFAALAAVMIATRRISWYRDEPEADAD